MSVKRGRITFYGTVANVSRQVMEFVKGRIFTDNNLGELSPTDRRKA
jgi:hypothetical protein